MQRPTGNGASGIGTGARAYIRYRRADDALWKGCKQLRRGVTGGNGGAPAPRAAARVDGMPRA
jgi:hypothetical protein